MHSRWSESELEIWYGTIKGRIESENVFFEAKMKLNYDFWEDSLGRILNEIEARNFTHEQSMTLGCMLSGLEEALGILDI